MRQLRCVSLIFAITAAIIGTAATTEAGDNFWSPAPGVNSVNEFAVCGTTVYAATETGLFRSDGDSEIWTRLRSNWTTHVACDGPKVIWQEIIGLVNTVFVSHDALQSVALVNGLAGAASSGIQDLAIGGDLALATTYWSVFRSADGGFNFPAAYPVLSESSGGYRLSAVWTNGTACAAAGSGGFAGNGVWHSPSGDIYTWVKVLDIGGQSWLDGSGHSTIISGDKYSGAVPNGYISAEVGGKQSGAGATAGIRGRASDSSQQRSGEIGSDQAADGESSSEPIPPAPRANRGARFVGRLRAWAGP